VGRFGDESNEENSRGTARRIRDYLRRR